MSNDGNCSVHPPYKTLVLPPKVGFEHNPLHEAHLARCLPSATCAWLVAMAEVRSPVGRNLELQARGWENKDWGEG